MLLLFATASGISLRAADLKRVRRLRGELPGYERQVWAAMADLGWLGILVPESHGGLGLGVREAATVKAATLFALRSVVASGDCLVCACPAHTNPILCRAPLPNGGHFGPYRQTGPTSPQQIAYEGQLLVKPLM